MIITANNNSLSNITELPSSIIGGGMTLISEQTASGSANLSFTSGIDDTYDSYVFKFNNIHPSARAGFTFNMSTDVGSNYNVTKTTTFFRPYHSESGDSILGYVSSFDLAQSTAFQLISGDNLSNDNDSGMSGELTLFNPSSTTFVKHFISKVNYQGDDYSINPYIAGYGNTTSAVNAVRFKMSSGNIDSGVIKLYGVS